MTTTSATDGSADHKVDLHKLLQLVKDGDESENKEEITSLLKRDKGLVDKQDHNGRTAIQYAVLCNRPKILSVLINNNANTRVKDSNGLSLAHHAAKIRGTSRPKPGISINGSEQQREQVKGCLEALIEHDSELAKIGDNEGQTPMHYAIMSNNMEAVQLLDKSTDKERLICKGDKNKVTPLHVAASYGRTDIAQHLLTMNVPIERDTDRKTPLHYACASGNLDMTNFLLQKCSSKIVNAKDKGDNTCLHLAAENGHEKIVEALIDKGADVVVKRTDGMYPIHLATIAGKLSVVKKVMVPADMKVGNNAASTPLHTAAEHNRPDIADYILEMDVKALRKRDKDGNTPLHKAAYHGNENIVKLLMDKGANVRDTNTRGQIPLHLAADQGNVDAFDELLSFAGTALEEDLWNMENSMIKKIEENMELLSHRENTSTRDQFIETIATDLQEIYNKMDGFQGSVHEETFKHIVEIVSAAQCTEERREPITEKKSHESWHRTNPLLRVLYSHTLINTEDHDVNTPLHLAARGGHERLVERILNHYLVQPNRKNDDERKPLHLAALHGKIKTAEKIICVSPNAVFAEDQKGNTPLHLAAQAGQTYMVEFLIQNKSDMHHKNLSGRTALDLAAAEGWGEICGLLFKAEERSGLVGSGPEYKTKDDKTPLYLACENGHLRVAKLLLDDNADVTAKAGHGKGWNCLDVAVENDHRDIALLIIRSKQWEDALQNSSRPNQKPKKWKPEGKRIDTPMRRLIRKMPDVAVEVLNKCSKEDFTNTYQFIDDLYESWTRSGDRREQSCNILVAYTDNARKFRKNHPLMIMVKHKREELLQHPLVNKLIKEKWINFGIFYYFFSLLIHLLFLSLLTHAIVWNKPPHEYTAEQVESIRGDNCDRWIERTVLNISLPREKFILYGLMIISIAFEACQMKASGKAYFYTLENYIDWVVYILTFLYLLDFNNCTILTSYREHWQWSLGAFALFFAWVDLVLYLKALTSLGLYVIMFQLVCMTFLKVFIVFFSLIGAFALGFHTLLRNQVSFRDVANSILKTSVMFLGELDYDGIFNEGVNMTGMDENLRYPAATSVMFSAFIILACIVLMNLLVGLAVDDIKAIARKANFQRTSMHIELVLNVEKVLPKVIRKRIYGQRMDKQEKLKERRKKEELEMERTGEEAHSDANNQRSDKPTGFRKLWNFIANARIWWWNQTAEPDENEVLKQIPELTKRVEELHKSFEEIKQIMVDMRRDLELKPSNADAVNPR